MKKIIISYNYTVGWYSRNQSYPDCLTHPEIISMVESKKDRKVIENKAKELWPNGHWNANCLQVKEVKEGRPFCIIRDQYEYVLYQDNHEWFTLL
jgi:hypothetical protein